MPIHATVADHRCLIYLKCLSLGTGFHSQMVCLKVLKVHYIGSLLLCCTCMASQKSQLEGRIVTRFKCENLLRVWPHWRDTVMRIDRGFSETGKYNNRVHGVVSLAEHYCRETKTL